MVVRGGPVAHAIARAGWLVFALLGAIVMIGAAVLFAATPDPESSAATNFVAALIVFVPIGAGLGALIGLPAQFAARSWLRSPSRAERVAALERRQSTKRTAVTSHGLRPDGRWARFYEACARSVVRYHQVVGTLSDGPGREWLAGIGKTLDAELAEALRLARLGESLEPTETAAPGETVYQVLERLREAKESFEETTERAAAIVLDLRDDSDFVQVRTQLDMLAEQAPQLRGKDA
jgi:hypothetical protein